MISFTSSGFALYKILIMIVLIHTDLPEPVAPAISKCGILAISATMTWPAISFPVQNEIFDAWSWNSLDSTRSRNGIVTFSLFGTSIPMADFPGIGASKRISGTARFNLISSASPRILLTFTPISGWISYCVTVGPQTTLVTRAFTPKFVSVIWSFADISCKCCLESPVWFGSPFCKRETSGNTYARACSSPACSAISSRTSATSCSTCSADCFGWPPWCDLFFNSGSGCEIPAPSKPAVSCIGVFGCAVSLTGFFVSG